MATKNVNKSAPYTNIVTNTSNTNSTTSTTTVDSVNGNSPIGISHSEHDDSIMNEVNSSPGNSQVNPEKSAPKVNSAKPTLNINTKGKPNSVQNVWDGIKAAGAKAASILSEWIAKEKTKSFRFFI